MSLFLGVDGGGTKTAFVLVSSDGGILARADLPGTYYLGPQLHVVSRILADGVADVCRQASVTPGDVDYAFFALPGYGEVSADVPALDAAPAAVLGHARYRCGNDMVAGWAGSLGGEDGINVVAGTGSVAYGERDGSTTRVGGWGELFGDEGSGYWIGSHGLNAFTRMSDGRLPRGPLYDLVLGKTGAGTDFDVIDVVFHRWERARTKVAALSRTVAEAALAGDDVAATILREASSQLVELVDTTRTNLGFGPREVVPVSYSGGVFKAAQVLQGFRTVLHDRHPCYELRAPRFEPAVGAALYAAKSSRHPLSPSALERLERLER